MLAGKLSLVTGASSGIGKAICSALLREGSKVVAVDINTVNRTPVEEAAFETDSYWAFVSDVSNQSSVSELLNNIKRHFGYIPECTVNCAGIVRDAIFLKMTEKQFDEVINVNLKGTYLITQAVAKGLVEQQKLNKIQKGGSIVNISSIVGKTGNIGQTNYSASKAGVIGMTKTIARELARSNIRCNTVLPGLIMTPMTLQASDKIIGHITDMIPLRRLGTPEEVAEACVFLLSDKSSYITGAAIEVTGGLFM